MRRRRGLMGTWAVRDLMRRPGEAILASAALATLVTVAATALLLTEAVAATTRAWIEAGPALVVRRVDAGGFAPVPLAAVEALRAVPGALDVRARVWGTVTWRDVPVSVVGLDPSAPPPPGLSPLAPETAVAGPGVGAAVGDVLMLVGPGAERVVAIAATLDERAVGLHDVLLVRDDEARALLGLRPGEASDLALEVHHPAEEDAIRRDVARALPFPVRLTTRREAVGAVGVDLGRRGSLSLLLLIPFTLAVLALVVGIARDRAGRSRELGIMKAAGWTTRDIARLHLLRAVAVGAPATTVGLAVAWALVLGPGAPWPGRLLLGWEGAPPDLVLEAAAAGLVLVEVAALVLLPWLAGALWPAVRAATRDPAELLAEAEP